ncbi:hypothetical protein Syun_021536 [Stephania yunnanensis]|uniref:Pectin acetylesterase n=1 Tax=Stephania yunnanensis TaxID=152371 RepID=A0AAP0IFS5_9MAGN
MAKRDQMSATKESTSGNMFFEPILEEGVFRFDCSGDYRNMAFPSLSFPDSKVRDKPLMIHKEPHFIPTFERLHGQQVVTMKGSYVFRYRTVYSLQIFTWNTYIWGYGPGTTSLYQSHPWVLVVLPNGVALGVLADTTRRCESVALSVGDWFFDRVGVSAIDCPYPCDNTCHNLVSKHAFASASSSAASTIRHPPQEGVKAIPPLGLGPPRGPLALVGGSSTPTLEVPAPVGVWPSQEGLHRPPHESFRPLQARLPPAAGCT